ncbi:MAG: Sulfatase protein, partial [Deltaproteobacteria bacterium]|nr:Sulfatase protein [Deltaproteobacteria bacterium]
MTRWRKSLLFIGVGLSVFSLALTALYLTYRDTFSTISGGKLAFSIIDGVRFDLSILLTAFLVMLFFFNLPLRLANARIWQRIWGWGMYAILILLTLLLAGDVIYFGDVKRHMTSELLVIGNDAGFIFELALGSYKAHLALFLLFAASLLLLWRFILERDTKESRLMPVKFLVFAGFMVLGIRGTFSDKPINIIDAFESGSTAQSNLVLNGVFTLYHHARGANNTVNHHFYTSFEEALLIVKTPLGDKSDQQSAITVQRSNNARPYNVVLMLLESWSPFYIDSFGSNGFGVTPNFDRITRDGLQFTNFYAVGQRSIEGIQAVLTGVPPLIGLPNLGFGLEASNFPKVGDILREKGYETIFMQSSRRRSFRVDAIARATGFEYYYGMEDMPMLLDYSRQKSVFGWDYESMMFLKSKLDAAKKPFFGFLFTGTTHTPYIRPGNGLEKYPHGENSENGFLNTLHYSDWSLGQFMKAAAAAPWFDDTIFIFTADHNFDAFRSFQNPERSHTPLVIYSPKLFKHQTVSTIGSQADLAQTVLDLLGIKERFA